MEKKRKRERNKYLALYEYSYQKDFIGQLSFKKQKILNPQNEVRILVHSAYRGKIDPTFITEAEWKRN